MEYKILNFYLDCDFCHKQEALMQKAEFFLPVERIEIDDDYEICEKYHVSTLPKLILVDQNGNEIMRWKGITEPSVINDYLVEKGFVIYHQDEDKKTEALLNQATVLIQDNFDVSTTHKAWKIVDALRLLIEANKLEEGPSFNKAAIVKNIALCNIKIGNMDMAHQCAKIAIREIDKALEVSPIVGDGLRDMLGASQMEEIVRITERGDYDFSEDFLLGHICLHTLNRIDSGVTKQQVKSLLDVMDKIVKDAFEMVGGSLAVRWMQTMEVLKQPLVFIWSAYDLGTDEEVYEEGDSLLPQMMFKSRAAEQTQSCIDALEESSPFANFERDGQITNALLRIYKDLLMRLKTGKIEIM